MISEENKLQLVNATTKKELEDIVAVCSGNELVPSEAESFLDESISHIVGGDAEIVVLGVVPVLLSYELAVEYHAQVLSAKRTELEAQHPNAGGRHKHLHGSGVDFRLAYRVPVFGIIICILVIHIVLDPVVAESQVAVHGEQAAHIPGGGKFHSPAPAAVDVLLDGITAVA